uniref:N-acetyltransferase domain-containing protein n=1 Tax=Macrostomum lignano TaxID=282301 RepID=A0A1I8I2B7_9PLAT
WPLPTSPPYRRRISCGLTPSPTDRLPRGLDDLLMRAGFENNTANEGWLICLLAGRPLPPVANRPLNCRLHPELAGCPDSLRLPWKLRYKIRRGTADDIEAVGRAGAGAGEQPQMACSCTAGSSAMSTTDAAGRPAQKLLVAADCQSWPVWSAFCCTRRLTCTASPSPGFYVQSLFVELDYRRHRVGQSLLATLGRLAASSGFGHLKLLVQRKQRAGRELLQTSGLYSRCSAVEHRLMMLAGLLRLLVAVAMATGRIVGFVLYTVSHVSQQDLPGLYVGQSLLATLGRLAASSGFGHLKLLVQRSNAPAVNCYRRLGFEFLSDTENIGFFELWPAKFVNSMLRAGRRPLPAGLSLELRDCDGRLSGGLEAGRRFALTCAACDCRLSGHRGAHLLHRPCQLLSVANLKRLLGRLALSLAASPRRLWLEAPRQQTELHRMLLHTGLEDLDGRHDGDWGLVSSSHIFHRHPEFQQLPAAMKPESSTATVVIRYGTPDDMYQVTCHEKELAKCHENMLQYCRLGSEAHRQMLMDGLFRIMVAEAEGRVIGYLLYTPSYLLRHAEPGFYVGQSLLATLGRLAASSGFGHLKLLVQHSNAPATSGVRFSNRDGEHRLLRAVAAEVYHFNSAGGSPAAAAGLHLELRDCGGRLSGKLETGRRFALTCAACDCRLQGTVALTYCMWGRPCGSALIRTLPLNAFQADLEAVRPSCPARGCALLNAANLRRLFGRLPAHLPACPAGPPAGRRDSRLRQLLIKIGLEDSTASELWHVCDLSGPGLSELAGRSVACPSRLVDAEHLRPQPLPTRQLVVGAGAGQAEAPGLALHQPALPLLLGEVLHGQPLLGPRQRLLQRRRGRGGVRACGMLAGLPPDAVLCPLLDGCFLGVDQASRRPRAAASCSQDLASRPLLLPPLDDILEEFSSRLRPGLIKRILGCRQPTANQSRHPSIPACPQCLLPLCPKLCIAIRIASRSGRDLCWLGVGEAAKLVQCDFRRHLDWIESGPTGSEADGKNSCTFLCIRNQLSKVCKMRFGSRREPLNREDKGVQVTSTKSCQSSAPPTHSRYQLWPPVLIKLLKNAAVAPRLSDQIW